MLFGGNLIRKRAFIELKKNNLEFYRIATETKGSDHIMNNTLCLRNLPSFNESNVGF